MPSNESSPDEVRTTSKRKAIKLGALGRLAKGGMSASGARARRPRVARSTPGSTPGIESIPDLHQPPTEGEVTVQCIDYGADRLDVREVSDLNRFLDAPCPDAAGVRWVNVCGLHPYVVNRFRQRFGFHTLAAEDVLRPSQRPKMEVYPDHLFIVVRMVRLKDERPISEQVSLFLYQDTVLTFQEMEGDVWDPVRQRLHKEGSRLRQHDAGYLVYALLDALVDHFFPILEGYGDHLEQLEERVMEHPKLTVQQGIHLAKRDLVMLRRVIWPLRDLLRALQDEDRPEFSEKVRAYLRDVYDHAVQVMDIVETYRETAAGLNDMYMSAVSNRMNEIMKVLTLMASFFIPVTFIAGVYGMNFEYIPELGWKYSYGVFWGICLSTIAGLAWFFVRKGWIGGGK